MLSKFLFVLGLIWLSTLAFVAAVVVAKHDWIPIRIFAFVIATLVVAGLFTIIP